MQAQSLRIARPSDDLAALVPFYRDGLGFDVVASFTDHEGFEGIMFGREGLPYHLEFTKAEAHRAGRAPTQENLLVFYIPDQSSWQAAVLRMQRAGFEPVKAFNPYWDKAGNTFEDPTAIELCCKTPPGLEKRVCSVQHSCPSKLWRAAQAGSRGWAGSTHPCRCLTQAATSNIKLNQLLNVLSTRGQPAASISQAIDNATRGGVKPRPTPDPRCKGGAPPRRRRPMPR